MKETGLRAQFEFQGEKFDLPVYADDEGREHVVFCPKAELDKLAAQVNDASNWSVSPAPYYTSNGLGEPWSTQGRNRS